jgi:hypothetical protein
LQGPFGDGVGNGAGEVEGGERVEALDVAAPANAGGAGCVAGEVFIVDLFDPLFTHLCGGSAHAAGGLDARDSLVQARAGDPESRRHIPGALVLYNARMPERAPGGDAEGCGGAPELTRNGVAVAKVIVHRLLGG